ncbi:uncharacterized protein LOC122045079 [Zingiber officinale]|uniref:Uncharacterized protein n=1 Tax=Zingiber officinale TaxID=94328 RepID=A0A8J5HJG5_ZINOF|nr:uncharacterized protein LOC122045079 [Zingiber officinale]KAG6523209.1 hypothetical protein ZIOFF_013062 [Zingiber officinale]
MSKQRSGGRGAMRGDRRSSADASEVVLWREEEDDGGGVVEANGEEAGWKCWRHLSQPRYGVCPACLRDRLLLLCPDCARTRPCICGSFASSSSSSSSFSSRSSAEPIRSGSRRGDGAEIGAVGPVMRLIEREPAFQRSRSVGLQLLRSKPTAADVEPSPSRSRGPKIWAPFWRRNQPMEDTKQPNLYRSRSVAAGHLPDAGAGAETEGIRKRLRWHFPSPIKALRSRIATAKAVVR